MRLAVLYTLSLLASVLAAVADAQTFEVASVKLFNPEIPQPYFITGGPGTPDPSRFRAPRISMSTLLSRAFDVSTDQITGPAWFRDVSLNFYTVTATMPPDTSKAQFQKMLQNLLAERFHLVFHRETRDFPGYALVVDKDGPKFKEVEPKEVAPKEVASTPASAPLNMQAMMSLGRDGDGFPNLPPGPQTMTMAGRNGDQRTKYQERTMAEFVFNLGFLIGSSQGKSVNDGYVQPRVVDRTGLTGKYTFFLEYYSEGNAVLMRQLAPAPNSNASNGAPVPPSDPSGGPTIFAAIQKQLGLRLDKIASVPLDMIIVESVDKVPTPD